MPSSPGATSSPAARIVARWSLALMPSVFVLAMLANASLPGLAQEPGSAPDLTEYQIKAAFLYNFAKFVEWPPHAFSSATEPIVVGVLGRNPFGDELDRIFKSNTAGDRRMIVKQSSELQELKHCQIIFISSSEKKQLPQLLEILAPAGVLTIADVDGFSRLGGIVGFTMRDSKVHFQINLDAAERAGLKISSQLLKVATVVRDSGRGRPR